MKLIAILAIVFIILTILIGAVVYPIADKIEMNSQKETTVITDIVTWIGIGSMVLAIIFILISLVYLAVFA